ncbi:MAG: hypothetical protein R3F56_11530 [Planctomycetota bacterium]
MNSKLFLSLTVTALCGALGAQQTNALLFATKGNEETRSGSNGTSLRNLLPRSIGVVTPSQGANSSAENFGPGLAFQTLAGDENADGTVFAPNLTGPIDALTVLPYEWDVERGARPRTRPVTLLDCYISPTHDVGIAVSGAPGLRKGDCGRFVRTPAGNGQVAHFITAEQLISSLGMFDVVTQQPLTPADINLDAITVSVDRHIFVSFTDDHAIRVQRNGALVNLMLQDGAIACIPGPTWVPNARGEVANVLPNRGVVVLPEAQVDVLVVNAALTDNAGACVPAVDDVESLAIDPNGGTFTTQWGNQALTWPHLMFTGPLMTGAGVVTTGGGGQIAQVNGGALARGCGVGPTIGVQMGLAPSGSVSSLGALESLAKEPCWFVLGSPTPNGLGGAVTVDVGTNLPVAVVALGFGLGALPVSPSMSFLPWSPNTECFPEIYPTVLPNPLLPVAMAAGAGAARFGSITFPGSPVVGTGILFQGFTAVGANLHASSPLTLTD